MKHNIIVVAEIAAVSGRTMLVTAMEDLEIIVVDDHFKSPPTPFKNFNIVPLNIAERPLNRRERREAERKAKKKTNLKNKNYGTNQKK